jgi:hypothetical protein
MVETSAAATPYTFRIIGLQYNIRNSYARDFGNTGAGQKTQNPHKLLH